jgi:PPK2 family polyphosphate:nucleotide phosphotransferase
MATDLSDRIDLSRYRIAAGQPVSLADHDPADSQGIANPGEPAEEELERLVKRASDLQERLFAEGRQALLVVLQAMDTGGKDSTIRAVTRGLNPQGCHVHGFKAPTRDELARDFLWRVHAQVPPKGTIGIFNRSHYEDVLIVRVHGLAPAALVEARYGHINAFEGLLHDHGTRVLKIMLHISKEYQRERLVRRLERPDKHWKFNPDDLKERVRWDDYMAAFEVALSRCSTGRAPWYVVPAERRWFRNLVVARLVIQALEEMNPEFPEPSFDPAAYPAEAIV